MQQAVSAETKKANARVNSQPPPTPDGLQAPPVPVLRNQTALRLQRKYDCGGEPDCDCAMANDKKQDGPRTALHRKPSSTVLDAQSESFFEARQQRRSASTNPPLRIGAIDDPLEREADQVADRILRIPRPGPMRAAGQKPPMLQAKAAPASHASLRNAPDSVHQTLSSPGRPLDSSTRQFFEPAFGRDFSSVRVHTDAQAASSARDVQARAYTVGQQIAFGSGQYRPDSREGQHLLAHELSHVVQQGGPGRPPQSPGSPNLTALQRQPANAAAPAPVPGPPAPAPVHTGPAADNDAVEKILAASQEKQENGVGNYPAIFSILNGMWMAVMLPTIEEVKNRGFDLTQAAASTDMPRVQVAIAAVAVKTAGQPPATFAAVNPAFGSLPEPQQHELATYLGLPWPANQQDPQPKPSDSGSALSPEQIAAMSTTDRLLKAYEYASIGDALRTKIKQMIEPKQLVVAIVAGMAIFIGLQFTPVGWAADIGMVLTAAFVGKALSDALTHFRGFAAAADARTDDQIHQAGDEFAKAMAGLEVDTLMFLIMHSLGGGAKAAGTNPPPSTVIRFAKLIGPNGEVFGLIPVAQASAVPVITAVQAAQLGLKGTALSNAMMSEGGSGSGQGPQPPQGTPVTTPTPGAKGVEIVDSGGKSLGEFDEVQSDKFIEDKAATGLDTPNPRTGVPQQTPDQWAQRQIFDKTVTRIENFLNKTTATRVTKNGSPSVPTLAEIKDIRQLVFRVQGSSPEVIAAVHKQVVALTAKYSGWTFSAIFGS